MKGLYQYIINFTQLNQELLRLRKSNYREVFSFEELHKIYIFIVNIIEVRITKKYMEYFYIIVIE